MLKHRIACGAIALLAAVVYGGLTYAAQRGKEEQREKREQRARTGTPLDVVEGSVSLIAGAPTVNPFGFLDILSC